MNSVWIDSVNLKKFDSLKKNIKTDVAIIGGGMAGILTAYMLKKKGVDSVIIEASKIGYGVTKNTTAKITSQHGLIYNKLKNKLGYEKAKQYLTSNELALKEYKELCQSIECNFCEKPAYVYSLDDKVKIYEEIETVNVLGLHANYTNKTELPFPIEGAIEFENQAEFNPLKFISEISKDLTIYENTMVREIKNRVLITDNGNVKADKIVVATHFPFINVPGFYFAKMYQQRSYVLALENAQKLNGMHIDGSGQGLSFRNYKDLLLLGGGGHRTGKDGGGYNELRQTVKKLYPNAVEKYSWATQDCMTLDYIPYIGKYSKNTDSIFVATGFNKWGMTSSMVSGMILSDMILDIKNEYEELYNPCRFSLNKQFFINSLETTANLINLKPKRCSHLGCALHYNKQEHTWDCSCHGSRFDENGKIIDNPATKDIKI